MRLGIKIKPDAYIEKVLEWGDIEKSFKYLRRWMGKNGKWQYLYADDLLHPVKAVKRLFGLEEQKVTDDYKANSIKKEYETDKKTFANHTLEYLSNRLKWDKIFSDKESRAKYDKPVKQKDVLAAAAVEKLNDDGTPSLFQEKTPKTNIVNRSLMKKVWEIYNPQKNLDITPENTENKVEGEKNGEDQSGIGSGELPADTPAVRDGGGEGASDLNVHSPRAANNAGESGGAADQPGGSPGRNFRGRRGRSAIKEIREQVKKLLSEKKDDEFTEADKALLRQYEGGGGLAEKEATTHGTLYEFYTPQKVISKVWQLVDKYNPRIDKTVIEPSAGTGRFAENRLEKFDLFELDETSSRIARILHPDANIKQGYFQELFMNGRTPKKEYDGKKYDVAIGNPPYGDYSGLHRGLGEGKIHTKIDEYFIDRSLDTLKDGGILAMVVPSSFLRGKNSKAKQAIAKKARLLEAWRLPNGTFGTTGVGTDIIVLRKEHGDLIDFQNDCYFQKNEGNIVGVESEKLGRFGMEKYVAPPDGMGFDEAIDSIDPGKVPAVQIGELSPAVQAAADVTVSAADEHKNRSEAMMGNQNAKKDGLSADNIYRELHKIDFELWQGGNKKADGGLYGISGDIEKYKKWGGTEWIKGDQHRIYFNGAKALKNLYGLEITNTVTMPPGVINKRKAEAGLKYLPLGDQDPTEGYIGQMQIGGKRAWEMLTSKPYYDVKKQEFVGLSGPMVETSIAHDRAILETLKKYRDGKIPNIQQGLNVDGDIKGYTESLSKMGYNDSDARSRSMMGNDNAAGEQGGAKEEPEGKRKKNSTDDYTRSIGKNMTTDEFNEKYGIKVEKGDIPIWKATDFAGRIEVKKLSKKDREYMMTSGNFTVDQNGVWYANVNYASGNIYEKLDELNAADDGTNIIGYKVEGMDSREIHKKNKALLEAVLPAPKAAENIKFSPISDFVKEYKIKDAESVSLMDLRKAFEDWAKVHEWGSGRRASKNWNSDMSPISQYEIPPIINFYDVLNYIWQIPQKTDKATAKELDSDTARMEAAKKREARRECAERLFNRFIQEGLSEDKRKDLVEAWNRRFNAYVKPDYRKIPVIINGMNTHKGEKKFDMKIEQVETVSFMCNKGNGISAANVGVGKTIIGEAVAVNRIQTGNAKRPLVVVPKAVYRKWIKEFHQHFPDMVVNELQNFGKEHIARFLKRETGLNIPEGTITVCTMEALQKVTFKDETLNTELIDDMMDSQTIYDAETQEKRSPKERAEERESMLKRLGKGAKAKEGYLYWEDCGFDCVLVDEIHGFKNVFGQTRSFSGSNKDTESKDRQSNEFKGLTGGESDRAMKLFAITQLVQKQNNGQNVFGLSATPFTNSPIEIYNMLSLVARNKLKELHIYNMYKFLAQFAEIKSEWSVGTKGDVVEKEVMKNWKNLGALQNLITEYMLYVDADEAGVIRPKLRPHAPQLELTPLQKAIIEAETDYMTNADPRKDPGATLKAINYMRMATLSPASINRERLEFYQSAYPDKFKGLKIPKSEDFVTSSPKMTFVCDSVSKAYKKLPNAGQIIYLPRGVNDFVHVKQYLMDQGMPEDSIAFMHSKTTLDEKERIKEEFNDPNGKIKVIIGSETIKEGVSLNGNTHSIYNCMLGWNPTEAIQVTGRAHRQGNKQGHVHVIYPLMADSIDSLMYQKHDEKSARINEIWSYKGDTSADVSDINPETLKFELIKDPAKKANFIVGQKRDKIRADRRIEEARYEVLYKDIRNFERAEDVLPECKRDMDAAESEMLKKREARDKAKSKVDELEKKKADQYTIMTAKRALDHAKWELEQATSVHRTEKKVWKEYNDQSEMYRNKFRKMGIRPGKEDEKLKEISASIQKLKDQEESIENSYAFELEKAKKELEAQRKKIPPISSLVDENVSSIMGDLRPMDEVKKEIEAEMAAKGEVKKSFVFLDNRLFIKVS
jgi:hypothetical protein